MDIQPFWIQCNLREWVFASSGNHIINVIHTNDYHQSSEQLKCTLCFVRANVISFCFLSVSLKAERALTRSRKHIHSLAQTFHLFCGRCCCSRTYAIVVSMLNEPPSPPSPSPPSNANFTLALLFFCAICSFNKHRVVHHEKSLHFKYIRNVNQPSHTWWLCSVCACLRDASSLATLFGSRFATDYLRDF